MYHLAGNKFCAIDCETTGLSPSEHDIWQVCFLPLDADLKPDKSITPFEIKMKPRNPENRQPFAVSKAKITNAILTGLEYEAGATLFDEWYHRLELPFKKRIIPLAHNWPYDCSFITEWLGPDSVNYYFDGRYRDTMVIAGFLNEVCVNHANFPAFQHLNLRSIATQLEIEWDEGNAHDALYDCHKTAEVYRRLTHRANYIGE